MSMMARRRTWLIAVLAHIAVLLGVVGAARAQAPAESWLVVETSGDAARQAGDGIWQALAAGEALPIGTAVKTGGGGRVVLTHQGDRVTVSANSALVLRAAAAADPGPSILQSLGTLLFHVDHRPGRRFEVQTPYLAAVVKGTVFTVTVREGEHSVHVAEGAVEVTNLSDHRSVLTRPGETALVALRGKGVSIVGAAAPSPPRRSEAQPAASDPSDRGPTLTATRGQLHLDIAALTHGLARNGNITTSGHGNAAGGGKSAAASDAAVPLIATIAGTDTTPHASASPGVWSSGASANPADAVTAAVGAVGGAAGPVGTVGATTVGAVTGSVDGVAGAAGVLATNVLTSNGKTTAFVTNPVAAAAIAAAAARVK